MMSLRPVYGSCFMHTYSFLLTNEQSEAKHNTKRTVDKYIDDCVFISVAWLFCVHN
jgi:hypothetical protein